MSFEKDSDVWGATLRDFTYGLSQGPLELFPQDLSSVMNNPEKLEEVVSWLGHLDSRGQKAVFMLSHDTSDPVSHHLGSNAIVFRTSMNRSLDYTNEYLIPVFLGESDFKSWEPLPYVPIPSVGFVGHSSPELHHGVLTLRSPQEVGEYGYVESDGSQLLRTPVNIGLILRARAVRAIESTKGLKSAIIQRNSHHFLSQASRSQERSEFLDNLGSNPYSLCIRGSGNYSIRLFETLAAGRIPVMLDTDQVMPMESAIDWSGLGLEVKISELDSLGEEILNFHESLESASFLRLQIRARETWERFLRKDPCLETMLREIARGSQE